MSTPASCSPRACAPSATASSACCLPLYLLELGLGPLEVGIIATATLLGLGPADAGRGPARASLPLSHAAARGDRADGGDRPRLRVRRRVSGRCSSSPFVGTLNPSSGDVSVFLPLEHAVLSRLVGDRERTAVFARYSLVGSLVAAVGSLAAAAPSMIGALAGFRTCASMQAMFVALRRRSACSPRSRIAGCRTTAEVGRAARRAAARANRRNASTRSPRSSASTRSAAASSCSRWSRCGSTSASACRSPRRARSSSGPAS